MDKFVYTCVLFTMLINAKKTVLLAQRPAILLNDTSLEVVSKFCYLKSIVSSNLSLDKEIDIHIGRGAIMFGKLSTRVWDNKRLTTKTKMIVYQTCVLSILYRMNHET